VAAGLSANGLLAISPRPLHGAGAGSRLATEFARTVPGIDLPWAVGAAVALCLPAECRLHEQV